MGPLKCCYGNLGWYGMLLLLHSYGEDKHIAVIPLHVFAKDHNGGFDANMGLLRTIIML